VERSDVVGPDVVAELVLVDFAVVALVDFVVEVVFSVVDPIDFAVEVVFSVVDPIDFSSLHSSPEQEQIVEQSLIGSPGSPEGRVGQDLQPSGGGVAVP